jgi:hypothetical protein
MPELGKYKKIPRKESIEIFKQYISTKPNVYGIQEVYREKYIILRKGKADIKVYLTNIYIVSEADVYEILSMDSDIDCIVTMSNWNSYTLDAKKLCKQQGIGLFEFSEFLGAVYYDGNKFLDYEPPKPDESLQRWR